MNIPTIVCYSNNNNTLSRVICEIHNYFGHVINQFVFNREKELFSWLEKNKNQPHYKHLFVLEYIDNDKETIQLINKINSYFLSVGILIIADKIQQTRIQESIGSVNTMQFLTNTWNSDNFKTAIEIATQSLTKLPIQGNTENQILISTEKEPEKLEEHIHKLMDANMAKDSFLSIIAHDLKGPFFSLLGISEILLNEWENLTEESKLDLIGDLHKTSDDTYKLLVTLLDWSKLQKEKLEVCVQEVNICNLVNSTLKTTKNNASVKGIKIENKINAELKIRTDRNMIATVFRNLISNAVQYTQPEGKIIISATEEKDFFTFCIEDNGAGIDKPHILELFKHDNQKKLNGNFSAFKGLGLIISKDFVEKNGGQIWLETQKGVGSKFYFTLPC
ncbi:MAG TPA: HAMP domain-containing sensor histidine kinase [Draconibacterium sp.]|nr:HAMP domain-containing sensor histidine kinase [Draconibacterium sp.]